MTQPSPAETPRFLNRELSWLEFNQRVLDEAFDAKLPPLERLKFLAITGSNLDEFFMVRVGGLQLIAQEGGAAKDPAGVTAAEQLDAISRRTHQMVIDQYRCFLELEAALGEAGVRRVRPGAMNERQLGALERVFADEVYSVLTPQSVVLGDPNFPLLPGQRLQVCVQLAGSPAGSEPRFAIIPLGRALSRLITVPSEGGYGYVLLEDAVRMFVQRFFPGEEIVESVPFRITRNADLALREDSAPDLLAGMSQILVARKEGDCVRLEVSDHVTTRTLAFLQAAFEVENREVYVCPGPLDLSAFFSLSDLQGFDALKNEPWPPQSSPLIDPTESVFESILQRDVLLFHPYESFDPVMRFVEEAAADPDVLAIKQILYRTSRKSPIVAALARAAERGKHVTVIVELKARFDEARNIEWAKALEQSGVQVVYGVRGLKTHAKCCVVVRREPHGIVRYVHFGTGNYNEITARIYSDVSLLTCNDELGADAVSFFNAITGYSQPQRLRKLRMAPIDLRDAVLQHIRDETERIRHGQQASITAKLNSLVDPHIIEALYEASQAGVAIRLNIRGICCLRPGVKGLSENIEVISVVDRFLEHARIFYFHHGGESRIFISSADWMPRNLDRRVELLIPVEDVDCRNRLLSVLETYFQDTVKAKQLQPDGSYRKVKTGGRKKIRSQELLYRRASQTVKQSRRTRHDMFEPHRAPSAEE